MKDNDQIGYLVAHFSGHVQGVGFRYAASQVAKGFEVTGYVKNLLDGRVELEAEGSLPECRAFLAAVQDELDSFIRQTEASEGRRARRHTRFQIL